MNRRPDGRFVISAKYDRVIDVVLGAVTAVCAAYVVGVIVLAVVSR